MLTKVNFRYLMKEISLKAEKLLHEFLREIQTNKIEIEFQASSLYWLNHKRAKCLKFPL